MMVTTLLAPLDNNSPVALAKSEDAKEYKKIIKVVVSEPTIEAYEGYQIAKIENYNFTDEPSAPMLPVKSFSLAIPAGAEIKDIKATYSQKKDLRGEFDIFPAQEPTPISKSSQAKFTPKNSSIYSSTKQFPGKLFEYAGEGNLRGQRILSVNVYPLQYNPAEKKLTFYEDLEIEVKYTYDKTQFAGNKKAGSDEFVSMAKKIVSNPEDVEMSAVVTEEATGLLPTESVEHLIITSNDFEAEFQVLADHKISKGVSSKVVTLEWIMANYTGVDNQERIRNFIKDARVSWDTAWVLLGGDTNIVPHRLAYIEIYLSTGLKKEYIPTDSYYSNLDGSWDADGDLIYGETIDGVDFYPDVFVGRAPVDTIAEVNVFVDKTITYELGPSGYEASALFLAEYLDSNTDGGITKDLIKDESMPNNFSVTKLYESAGNLSSGSAIEELNKGYGIINHVGHANYYILSMGSGYLDNSDMNLLNNSPKSSIFYSEGCWSNALDKDSVAEHFILNPNGGGIAYAGNSRYGLYYSGSPGVGPSDKFDRSFFDSLFNKGLYNIGMTFADSKAVYASYTSSAYRYLQYSLNLLGDPETTIWTVSAPEPPALSVAVEIPDKVNVGDAFTVSVAIYNSGTETATSVSAEMVLPEGLSTTESTNKNLGDLIGKETRLTFWNINADQIGMYDIIVNASVSNADPASGVAMVEVVIPDSIPPTVDLFSPKINAIVGDDETVIFQYIPTDDKSGIANCKLMIEDEVYGTSYEITNKAINEFAISRLDAGMRIWSIICVDDSLEMNEGISGERTLIVEDRTPPKNGYVYIMDNNAGSANDGYTSDVEPGIYLNANGANYVALSCDNLSFSNWISFSEYPVSFIYSDFNLETGAGCVLGDGLKTVYAKFKDEVGHEGAYASDTTTLDRIAPVIASITGDVSGTTGDNLEISLTVSESDIKEIAAAVIYIDGTDNGIVMGRSSIENTFAYNYTVPADSVASHSYYVMVYDLAENSSRSPKAETYTITVTDNDNPIAIAGPDRSVSIGDVVIFNASESSDNIGIKNYSWNFGDDNSGLGMNIDHIYTTAGTYTITLTVEDYSGATATDTVIITVTVPNQPPVADAGGDQIAFVNTVVSFDGSNSYDPDGDIVSYNWDFGDRTYASGASVTHTYTTAGIYTATLTVTDNGGAIAVDTATIVIEENVVEDVITVTKAQYDSKKKVLVVQATSSAGDGAVLTVEVFGEMYYNADRNLFTLTTYCTGNPGNIIVFSDLGGSTEIAVTNKFKER